MIALTTNAWENQHNTLFHPVNCNLIKESDFMKRMCFDRPGQFQCLRVYHLQHLTPSHESTCIDPKIEKNS